MAIALAGAEGARLSAGHRLAARRGGWAPQLPPRGRRTLCCRAGGADTPWRFDDLAGAPSLTSFDDLWREQIRAMERAQSELLDVQRQMDQRFEAAAREAARLEEASRGQGVVEEQQQGGPCGYRWQRSERHAGSGGTYHRSESFTVIGVQPPHSCGMYAAPPAATHLAPSLGLLLAAALAGFWAAATAAFNRRFDLTIYREESRWRLLLLWPLLLLTSAEFRRQFWAAARGRRAGPPLDAGGNGTVSPPAA